MESQPKTIDEIIKNNTYESTDESGNIDIKSLCIIDLDVLKLEIQSLIETEREAAVAEMRALAGSFANDIVDIEGISRKQIKAVNQLFIEYYLTQKQEEK